MHKGEVKTPSAVSLAPQQRAYNRIHATHAAGTITAVTHLTKCWYVKHRHSSSV